MVGLIIKTRKEKEDSKMDKYLNLIGWFTFADGRREFLSTFKGGRIDLALAVMEHGEVVGFSTEK